MAKKKFSTKVKMAVFAFLLFLASLFFQPAPAANVSDPDTQANGSSWTFDLRMRDRAPERVEANGSSWSFDFSAPPPPPTQ